MILETRNTDANARNGILRYPQDTTMSPLTVLGGNQAPTGSVELMETPILHVAESLL